MRGTRSTILLMAAFFVALLTLWGLERAGVPTDAERLRRGERVLPALIDLDPAEIDRVEIDQGDHRLVLHRRGPRRWMLADPPGADASFEEATRLIATLRGLRPAPEAGNLDAPASSLGLAPPAATIRLWRGAAETPIATLELGRVTGSERFVRSGSDGSVAVVAARSLADVERPAVAWREPAPIPPGTFPVAAVSFRREGMNATVVRGRRGEWRLQAPVAIPADGLRIDGLCEALGALRVDPDANGFVADHPADHSFFGLDPPVATIELTPAASDAEPVVVMVGSSPPDRPGDVYVRLGGRDDVMAASGRFLRLLPESTRDLRHHRVADFDPAAVDRVELDGPGGPFRLERDRRGWSLSAPVAALADRTEVESLLAAAADLYAMDFFEPGVIGNPGVEPPSRRLRIWEAGAPGADSEPAFSLAIGRHDALRKVVFARVDGDDAILALPDAFLSALPSSPFALRDAALPSVAPTTVTRLTIVRPGRTTVLEPGEPTGEPNRWRMRQPVDACADARAIAGVLAWLAEPRASGFVAAADADPVRFGLDEPRLEVRWESSKPGSLRVGSPMPDDPSRHYASLTGCPAIFALDAATIARFGAEFHETRVLSFPPEAARRLVLRTETRTIASRRSIRPSEGGMGWVAESGEPTPDVDRSRFDDLVRALAELRAVRFVRYDGPFPLAAGLDRPRLTVDIEVEGRTEPIRLRVGSPFAGGWVCAATGSEPAGSVFLLSGPAWEELIRNVEGGLPPIPDDPFAPP